MLKLIFFNENKYNTFHQKYKFNQAEIWQILNQTKYNIPKIYNQNLNFELLKNLSLNILKPIYILHAKNLNFNLAKNLFLANLISGFNLIIFFEKTDKILAYKKFFKNAIFLPSTTSKNIKELLYNLNINFQHKPKPFLPNFNKILINSQNILAKCYNNFFMEYAYNNIEINETYLNGNYYFIKNNLLKNKYFIKKILKNNYFSYFIIKKIKNKIILIDILNKKEFFVSCSQNINNFYLTKSKCGRFYVLVIEFYLNKNQTFNIYIGEENININTPNLKQKLETVFNEFLFFKIKSLNQKTDNIFNKVLPLKIVKENILSDGQTKIKITENFCDFKDVLHSYEAKKINAITAHFAMKNLLVSFKKDTLKFNSKFKQNLVLEMCFANQKKQIIFQTSENKNIMINGVKYFNSSSISYQLLKKIDNIVINAE